MFETYNILSLKLLYFLAKQRDPETGKEPDVVEFYRNMRWNNKKGWIAPEAEENYVIHLNPFLLHLCNHQIRYSSTYA